MYALFEAEFGIRMVRAHRTPQSSQCPAMKKPNCFNWKAPCRLLSVERLAFTYHDTPMEWRRGLYRTDTHYYRQ
jgi:GntR family transcriptional regulator